MAFFILIFFFFFKYPFALDLKTDQEQNRVNDTFADAPEWYDAKKMID